MWHVHEIDRTKFVDSASATSRAGRNPVGSTTFSFGMPKPRSAVAPAPNRRTRRRKSPDDARRSSPNPDKPTDACPGHCRDTRNLDVLRFIWTRNLSRTCYTQPQQATKEVGQLGQSKLGPELSGNSVHFESIGTHPSESKSYILKWPKGENFCPP